MNQNQQKQPLDPIWYNGKEISAIGFARAFLQAHPLKCVHDRVYDVNGHISDEEVQQMIFAEVEPYLMLTELPIRRLQTFMEEVYRNKVKNREDLTQLDRIENALGELLNSCNGRISMVKSAVKPEASPNLENARECNVPLSVGGWKPKGFPIFSHGENTRTVDSENRAPAPWRRQTQSMRRL